MLVGLLVLGAVADVPRRWSHRPSRGGGRHRGPPPIEDYWSVLDEDGRLLGFYCIGARPGFLTSPLKPDSVDIGVGMRPDLVGKGHGREFASVVLAHCRGEHPHGHVRAVVQTWNERSQRLAASMGLQEVGVHARDRGWRSVAYTVLRGRL